MWKTIFLTLVAVSPAYAGDASGPRSFLGLHKQEILKGNTSLSGADLFGSLTDRSYRGPLLSTRDEECPPGESFCPDGIHCVDPGYFCCTGGEYSCPDGGQCCYEGSIHCTNPEGFCCGEFSCDAGETCCDPYGCGGKASTCCGQYYCDPGETCCANDSGCAEVGYTCCGENQCSSDEQCCSNGNGCAPKTGTCCGKDYFCYQGNLCCVDQEGDNYCNAQCVETLILDRNDYNDPTFDEIFENMCRGILKGSSYSSETPNEVILEYNGPGNTLTGQNRVAAGCRGSGRLQCVKVFGTGWSCDEFPFASTSQGGSDAATICIPTSINSAIGGKWGNMVKGKTGGTEIRIKIKNFDCSTVSEKRALLERAGILANNTNALYLNGSIFGNYSQGSVAMLVPLDVPDDFIGTFNIDYRIAQGSLISGSIIDDDGEDYGDIKITNSGQTATGSIDVGPDGVGNVIILGWAADVSVSLNVSTSLQTSTAAATSTAPAATLTNSGVSTVPTGGAVATSAKSAATTSRSPPNIWMLLLVVLGFGALQNI